MNVHLSQKAVEGLFGAPLPVQEAFIKHINCLVRNLNHPSLRAKKFDESKGRWRARVNDDWRFYFTIDRDTYASVRSSPIPNSVAGRRWAAILAR